MASADMAEAVEHALVGQDMIGGDQVGDSRRIDRSSGFGGLRRCVHAGRKCSRAGTWKLQEISFARQRAVDVKARAPDGIPCWAQNRPSEPDVNATLDILVAAKPAI
jgi:hypothetical protein